MRSSIACLSLAFALVAINAQFSYSQDPEPAVITGDVSDETAEDLALAGDLPLDAEQIRSYQLELKARGYFFGPVDGRKGPRTRSALRNFQRAEGLVPSGSLDQATLDRLGAARTDSPATLTEAAPADGDPTESAPLNAPAPGGDITADDAAQPKPVSGQTGRVRRFFGVIGGGIRRGVGAVVGAGRTSAEKTADAGQAVGKAGTVTATASASAAVAGAEAVKDAAVKVADTSVGLYQTGKRKVTGDKRTDEQIKRSLEMQFSEDERVVPSEIEVRVSEGNVTLALPQSPRSDVPHAVRLAKLTSGVKSVNTVFIAPKVIVDDASTEQSAGETVDIPASDPPADPPPYR